MVDYGVGCVMAGVGAMLDFGLGGIPVMPFFMLGGIPVMPFFMLDFASDIWR